jgi:hypothetical protein
MDSARPRALLTPEDARVLRARIRESSDPTPGLVLHAFITRAWQALDYEDWSAFCRDVLPFHDDGRALSTRPAPLPTAHPTADGEGRPPSVDATGRDGLRPARIVTGSFDVNAAPGAPLDDADGVVLTRTTIDKRFRGPLDATGCVHMTSARTPVADSAGYVAVERITGTLDGRAGSFVTLHTGVVERGQQSLTVAILPDSGTGELTGISGQMGIDVLDGRHHYTLTYDL